MSVSLPDLPGNQRTYQAELSEGAEFGLHRLLCADALEGTDGCHQE